MEAIHICLNQHEITTQKSKLKKKTLSKEKKNLKNTSCGENLSLSLCDEAVANNFVLSRGHVMSVSSNLS